MGGAAWSESDTRTERVYAAGGAFPKGAHFEVYAALVRETAARHRADRLSPQEARTRRRAAAQRWPNSLPRLTVVALAADAAASPLLPEAPPSLGPRFTCSDRSPCATHKEATRDTGAGSPRCARCEVDVHLSGSGW